MKGGGHSQTNIDELLRRNISYKIEKIYENGVRIGGVEGHEENIKKLGNTGQAWFPQSWSDDEVLKAGTYTANKPAKRKVITMDDGTMTGYEFFQEYKGVTVGIYADLQYNVGTIFPDGAQRSIKKGEEWNGYQ